MVLVSNLEVLQNPYGQGLSGVVVILLDRSKLSSIIELSKKGWAPIRGDDSDDDTVSPELCSSSGIKAPKARRFLSRHHTCRKWPRNFPTFRSQSSSSSSPTGESYFVFIKYGHGSETCQRRSSVRRLTAVMSEGRRYPQE